MRHRATLLVLAIAILATACDESPEDTDAMVTREDAGPDADGSVTRDDGGELPDAGPPPPDLGPPIAVPGEVLIATHLDGFDHQFSSLNRDGSGAAPLDLPTQQLTLSTVLSPDFVGHVDGPRSRTHGFFSTAELPGGRVVFVSKEAGTTGDDHWLMLYDGTNLRRVAVGPDNATSFADIAVSPDSTIVFWSNDDQLHAVRVDGTTWTNGSTDRILSIGTIESQLEPLHQDSRWVYVKGVDSLGAPQLHRVRVDGSAGESIVLPAGFAAADFGTWRSSADGSVAAFVAVDAGGLADVFVVDDAGVRNVSNKAAADISSYWMSPDGSRVAYTTDGSDAFVVGADGTGEISIRGTGRFDAAVDFDDLAMADASTLYFSAGAGSGSRDVYSVSLGSLSVVNLTATGSTTAPFDGGDFNVHERFLAGGRAHYVLQNTAGLCDNCYYLASLAAGSLTYVIEDGDGYPRDFTEVSPHEIVFISGEDNLVYTIHDLYAFDPTAPAPARRITDVGGLRNRTMVDYELSPDGSRVTFVTDPLRASNHELWVIATSGGTAEQVGSDQLVQSLRWMRNSAGFVHVGAPDGEVPSLFYTSLSTPSTISAAPADMHIVGTR